MKRRGGIFAIGCFITYSLSAALRPSRKAAETYTAIKLEDQVPKSFFDWRVDPSITPILPNPSTQEKLKKLYDQTLARTYVNRRGEKVMLSIAYGADQGSDDTQAHRPEICYAAQGFSIKRIGRQRLSLGRHEVEVERLLGTRNARSEYISYWVTLNDKALIPGFSRKLAQIRLGLSGIIPDGMLMRTSTIAFEQAKSFELQGEFLAGLYTSLADSKRSRYFGS